MLETNQNKGTQITYEEKLYPMKLKIKLSFMLFARLILERKRSKIIGNKKMENLNSWFGENIV